MIQTTTTLDTTTAKIDEALRDISAQLAELGDGIVGSLYQVDEFAGIRQGLLDAAAGDPLVTDAIVTALESTGNAGFGRTSATTAMDALLDARNAIGELRRQQESLEQLG